MTLLKHHVSQERVSFAIMMSGGQRTVHKYLSVKFQLLPVCRRRAVDSEAGLGTLSRPKQCLDCKLTMR